MKVYILTKKGTQTPVRDWDGNITCFTNKKTAKEHMCAYGTESVRAVILNTKARGLGLGAVK